MSQCIMSQCIEAPVLAFHTQCRARPVMASLSTWNERVNSTGRLRVFATSSLPTGNMTTRPRSVVVQYRALATDCCRGRAANNQLGEHRT